MKFRTKWGEAKDRQSNKAEIIKTRVIVKDNQEKQNTACSM